MHVIMDLFNRIGYLSGKYLVGRQGNDLKGKGEKLGMGNWMPLSRSYLRVPLLG
jgi:hypothetical protein